MIKVVPKPMSEELRARFEEQVRKPGLRWLAENPVLDAASEDRTKRKRPPDYWREVKADLADAFWDRCAYTAMRVEPIGECDHFVSIDEDRNRAYEWENLRYCAGWVNSCKQAVRSSQILDPLQIEDDWFEILLPSLELTVSDRCPEQHRARAEFTLDRLKLRRSSNVIRSRRAYLDLYREHRINLDLLEEWAPLLARALRAQEEKAEP